MNFPVAMKAHFHVFLTWFHPCCWLRTKVPGAPIFIAFSSPVLPPSSKIVHTYIISASPLRGCGQVAPACRFFSPSLFGAPSLSISDSTKCPWKPRVTAAPPCPIPLATKGLCKFPTPLLPTMAGEQNKTHLGDLHSRTFFFKRGKEVRQKRG